MKKGFLFVLALLVSSGVFAQEEKVFITGFEDTEELTGTWTWTGGAFKESFVDYPTNPKPVEGDAALIVSYDNAGSEWQYGTLNLAIPPVNLTGMREIHMSVYFTPESTGDFAIRFDLPNGNILGFDYVSKVGEWEELVYKIDRKTSAASFMSEISSFYGFICPTPGTAKGEAWIDNIYAVRPANIPAEIEEVLVYGFNEADPTTKAPTGWSKSAEESYMPEMLTELMGDTITPTEGTDAMVMHPYSSYVLNIQTTDALKAFNRWAEVIEIQFDVRIPESVPGSWLQSRLVLRSGITGSTDFDVSEDTKEIGYADATSDWKTLLWEVDMTNHISNIKDPNGWFEVVISTNNDASADGFDVFIDNFRVTVPKVTDVNDWSLF